MKKKCCLKYKKKGKTCKSCPIITLEGIFAKEIKKQKKKLKKKSKQKRKEKSASV